MKNDIPNTDLVEVSDADRRLIDKTLRFVAERGWRASEFGFFSDLVMYLGETLGVAYVFCDMIDPDDETKVQTLALFAHGEMSENISYNLKGTPCENVIGHMTCCYIDKVQQLFPHDQLLVDLKAESYAGVPLWAADGTPLGLIAIMDDKPLTSPVLIKMLLQIVAVRSEAELERLQFLDRLKESERRFKHFAETSSDWFWEMDADLRFSYFSDRFEEVVGIPQDTLLGKTREATGIPNLDQDKWAKHLSDLKAHRPFVNFVHPRTQPNGQVSWLAISGKPVFGEGGDFRGYRGSGADITERKQADEAGRENQAILHAVVNVVPGMISAKGLDSRYIFMNSYQAKLYGTTPEKAIGKNSGELLSHQYGRRTEALDREVIETGIPLKPFEETYIDAAGVEHTWLTTKSPVKNEAGQVNYIVSSAIDISDRKIVEDQLIEAKEEAEQASKAKSEFLASMSHELRTPLNAILGFSDVLSGQYFGPPGVGKYREYAKDIHRSGEHLLELINDILDISSIEAGKTSLHRELLAIEDVIEDCIRIITENAVSKDIEVEVSGAVSEHPVYADKRAIKQILLNFLSNAIKFTPNGGKITVTTEVTERTTRIVVSDNGVGISPNKLPHVISPFAKGVTDPHVAEQGWGLGLAISKSLAELHGGQMAIESEVGKGTSVSIEIPSHSSDTA